MTARLVAAALLACAALTGCEALSSRALDATESGAIRYARTGDLRAEVDALARPLVASGETPGVVVGVLLPNGSTRFFAYGVADRASGRAPDADTVFAIGSLSKLFLGAMTASLVADGVLSWSDTLGDLLPAAELSADAKRITLLELATHTSGLPREPMDLRTLGGLIDYLFTGDNLYRHIDRRFVLDYLADFRAPPQRKAQYSNFGYAVLAFAVEERTGRSLDALLAQKLGKPLALKHTGYSPDELGARHARGTAGDQPKFVRRGTPIDNWSVADPMSGSAGLYSSAHDLLAFAAAHLNGRLSPGPATGWVVEDVDEQRITYKVGMIGGFASYLGLDAQDRTAVVVLQNAFNWTDKVGHRLLIRMHRAREMREMTANRAMPSARQDASP